MRCYIRHAYMGCVECCRTHMVDAMKTKAHSGSAIRLVRRRMTSTIRNILVSDDSELVGRNFLIVAPVGRNFLIVAPVDGGHPDINVIHVTADNVGIVRGMATDNNLDIYELITEER